MPTTAPTIVPPPASNLLQGILIDPYLRTVTPIAIPRGLQGLYKAIQCGTVECPSFPIAGVQQDCWVDEEGLLKPCDAFFKLKDAHAPFAGRGVIMSTDDDGEMQPCQVTVEQVMKEVQFFTRREVRELLVEA